MSKTAYVKIIELPPTKVISFLVTESTSPEEKVYGLAEEFTAPRGLWDNSLYHQVYGFDNPVRKNKDDTHGREVWITVPEGYDSPENATVKHFEGGLYAVVRIKDLGLMDKAWKFLLGWVKYSDRYELGEHQHLEGYVNPKEKNDEDIILELYLPIRAKKSD